MSCHFSTSVAKDREQSITYDSWDGVDQFGASDVIYNNK